jgi:hypothetical protein
MLRILGGNAFFAQWARGCCLQGAMLLGLLLVGPVAQAQDAYERALDAIGRNDSLDVRAALAQLVQQQPDDAGVWLDMAMLFCSVGYASQATQLFDAIEQRFAPPPGILELIRLQRAGGCLSNTTGNVLVPVAQWRGQVGRGFESNANQGVRDLNVVLHGAGGPLALQLTPDAAAQSDGLTLLGLDGSLPLGNTGALGQLQWQARRFDSLARFDVQALTLAASQPWHLAGWRGQLEANASWMRLGDALYQRVTGLRVETSPLKSLPPGWQSSASAAWSVTQYPTLQNFGAHLLDVRSGVAVAKPAWVGQAAVGVQRDAALGARPGGDRLGWSAELGVRWPMSSRVQFELGGTMQSWQDQQPYAPGLIEQARLQRTMGTRAALVWSAGAQAEWVLEARQTRNNENIDLFGYDATSLRLSYQRRFVARDW